MTTTRGHLAAITSRPMLIAVPRHHVLVVDGTGERDGARFRAAAKALYTASAAVRRALGASYSLPPPEGVWPDIGSAWRWQLMMRQPPQVTADLVARVVAGDLGVRWESHAETLCAQALHVGPYREVRTTVNRMLTHVGKLGYDIAEGHHEIYLSNPQRTAPERLKTVVRYPVHRRG
ncbi:GyrI-like domain-containing protein [Actinoplanes palleronii]|nr:GyrI-like domain-containing protein [Actinoplanes palleronii]